MKTEDLKDLIVYHLEEYLIQKQIEEILFYDCTEEREGTKTTVHLTIVF